MNIIDFRKICFDKHNRAYFLRVQPDDLKVTLSQIFYVLSNLSWISNFDEDYIRESFQERAKATLADIYAKITTSSTDEVSSDAGEYVTMCSIVVRSSSLEYGFVRLMLKPTCVFPPSLPI